MTEALSMYAHNLIQFLHIKRLLLCFPLSLFHLILMITLQCNYYHPQIKDKITKSPEIYLLTWERFKAWVQTSPNSDNCQNTISKRDLSWSCGFASYNLRDLLAIAYSSEASVSLSLKWWWWSALLISRVWGEKQVKWYNSENLFLTSVWVILPFNFPISVIACFHLEEPFSKHGSYFPGGTWVVKYVDLPH